MNQTTHSRDFYGVRSGILLLGNEIRQQIDNTKIGGVVNVTSGYFAGKKFKVIGKGKFGTCSAQQLIVDAQSETDT